MSPRRDRDRSGRSRGQIERLDEAYLEAMAQLRDQDPDDETVAGPDGGRQALTAGEGWLQVTITADGMEASLQSLTAPADLSVEGFCRELADRFGVVAGIDEAAVANLIRRAQRQGQIHGPVVLARGRPPVPGEDGFIRYLFVPDAEAEDEPRLPFADLAQALSEAQLDEVLGQNVHARMVTPGQRIAERVPPGQTCLVAPGTPLAERRPASAGVPGIDVLGQEVLIPGREAHLEAADNVCVEADVYRADVYGYVCLLDGELSVLPPVWVAPDRMTAHFVHFPQAIAATDPTATPKPAWIAQALETAGVCRGILEDAVADLCTDVITPRQRTAAILAEGQPPRPGRDAHIEFTMDYEKRAGRIRDDGSIDLRERNSVVAVAQGQLLGQLAPPSPGEPGFDVTGAELAAEDGRELEFGAGDNVRQAEEGGHLRFYAEIDGAVYLEGDTVRVHPVVSISGDVDYDSGNIEVEGDVAIGGDVRSGFSVRAGGSVSIAGVIESGATVNARADVIAAKGIVGDTTRVISLGSVETRYVQNASVLAGGDITVGSYVFSGSLRAGGRIVVHSAGGERGGSIVGGEALATGGIQAVRVGSPDTDRTVVGIGAPPEVNARLTQLRQTLETTETEIRRLCQAHGLEIPEPGSETQAAAALSRSRRADARALAATLEELGKSHAASAREQAQLEAQVDEALRRGHIEVLDTVYADVHLRFGRRTSAVAENLGAAEFYLTEKGIRWRPLTP